MATSECDGSFEDAVTDDDEEGMHDDAEPYAVSGDGGACASIDVPELSRSTAAEPYVVIRRGDAGYPYYRCTSARCKYWTWTRGQFKTSHRCK